MSEKTAVPGKEFARFKGHVKSGVLVPAESVTVPDGTYWVSLQVEATSEFDALAEILALAQPIGPSDLAENFDHYTGRLITDDPSP